MGNRELTKYGTIKDGLCEKEHQNRRTRELGGQFYVNHLESLGKIKIVNNSIILKTKTRRTFPSPFDMKRKGFYTSTHDEIGAYRVLDVFDYLFKNRIFKISIKKFEKLTTDIQAPVSSLDYVLSGDRNIQSPGIYDQKKKGGEL